MVASGDDIESMCQIVSGNLKEGSTGDSRRRKGTYKCFGLEGEGGGDGGDEGKGERGGDGGG